MAGPVFKTALSPLVGDGRFDSFPSPPKTDRGRCLRVDGPCRTRRHGMATRRGCACVPAERRIAIRRLMPVRRETRARQRSWRGQSLAAWLVSFVFVCSEASCVRFVSGPSLSSSVSGLPTPMRIVYQNRGLYEDEDRVPSLLERALRLPSGDAVVVETVRTSIETEPAPGSWPSVAPGPRSGVTTVLVQPKWEVIGPRSVERSMLFMLTVGFWPLFDRDDAIWWVTVFDADRRIGSFEIRTSRHEWTWTPLLPLSPLNVLWYRRTTEVLASAFPGQLSAYLSATDDPHALTTSPMDRSFQTRRSPNDNGLPDTDGPPDAAFAMHRSAPRAPKVVPIAKASGSAS